MKKEHTCKHGNDTELCQETCTCTHGCAWHGTGVCGLCDCIKFLHKKKPSKK